MGHKDSRLNHLDKPCCVYDEVKRDHTELIRRIAPPVAPGFNPGNRKTSKKNQSAIGTTHIGMRKMSAGK